MPWKASDALGHTKKADTSAKQKTWAEIANKERQRCMGEGGDAEECDARAIRVANAAVAKIKEGDMSYRAYTMSTNNVLIPVNAIDVDGKAVPVAELVAAYTETFTNVDDSEEEQVDAGEQAMSEAVWTTAFVNDLPDSSFALIESGGEKDEEGKTKPRSLRHLPYKDAGGKVDVPHLRNALARLKQMKGVSAELKAKALQKLQAVAKKHLKTYQKEMQTVDLAVSLVESFGIELDEEAEAQLSESASGHVIALAETQAVPSGPRAPLLMDVALIKPGWGNKKDNHYYSREVLARDAKVFEGVKMYATDHRPDQKNVKTEVSVVKQITGFTDGGAPIAQVAVHDPDFAEATRNRAELGTLDSLECSILAAGRTKKGKAPDGEKGNIVEAITSATSVDWVTKAGAGGHAIALAESNTGGVNMDKEKIQELLSESELPPEAQERLVGAEYEDESAVKEAILQEKEQQAQQEEAPQKLEEAEVTKLLSETNLPSASKKRLAKGEYEDETALRESVLAEVEYVKKLTGSGSPFAQGGGTAPGEEQMSEADYETAYADILRRHGLHVPQQQEVA